MKLAEALIQRADIKVQIQQIVDRMKENVLIQEGDTPAEEVNELSAMYESMMETMEKLILKINRTNADTMLDDISLADAIAKRDCLKAKISAYRAVKEASLVKHSRYSISEIKYERTIDVTELQSKVDGYSRQYRELDTRIQERNWTTDLL